MTKLSRNYDNFSVTITYTQMNFHNIIETEHAFDTNNLAYLKTLVASGGIIEDELLRQFFEERDISKHPQILRWFVEEIGVLPFEDELYSTFDYSWTPYETADGDIDLQRWLLETYDIKANY